MLPTTSVVDQNAKHAEEIRKCMNRGSFVDIPIGQTDQMVFNFRKKIPISGCELHSIQILIRALSNFLEHYKLDRFQVKLQLNIYFNVYMICNY